MKPLFSVITVTYNASQWLERTIRSVQEQSYEHIEYLVIDGGSTDGTVQIIQNNSSIISYYVSEPDKGLYDAMNKGLLAAKGDYIWFLNAGDTFYSPETITNIVSALNEQQLPDIIYGETCLTNASGEITGMRRLKAPEKLTWKSFRKGMLVCHQSFVVKREMAPVYDLTYRLASDVDWCIRCLQSATIIYNTRTTLSCFLEAGLSTTQRKESLKERYHIMCQHYGKASTQMIHLWFAVRFYAAKWLTGRV